MYVWSSGKDRLGKLVHVVLYCNRCMPSPAPTGQLCTPHKCTLHSLRKNSRYINSTPTLIPENQYAFFLTDHVVHEPNDSDAAVVEAEIDVNKISIR